MSQIPTAKPARYVLRDLPLSARLVIAVFLISVGLGYLSAMVQLHMQHSSQDGNPLPSIPDVIKHFHGDPDVKVGALERLITAPEKKTLGGGPNGSMRGAFTIKDESFKEPLRPEREGEVEALLAWIHAGAPRLAYVKDSQPFPAGQKDMAITPEFKTDEGWKIKSILTARCVYCHTTVNPEDAQAANYPLDSYDKVKKYIAITRGPSLDKLAQTTHAHLLSFAMLFALTGLTFAFTSYPGIIRIFLAPLVLVAQVTEISCWWLARLDGPIGVYFAMAIVFAGAVVGLGLVLQIVLSLFNLFGWGGKFILLLLVGGAAYGAFLVHTTYIEPMLDEERKYQEVIKMELEKAKPPANNPDPPKDKDNKPMP